MRLSRGRASRTALYTALCRAQETRRRRGRLLDDPYAARFLGMLGQAARIPLPANPMDTYIVARHAWMDAGLIQADVDHAVVLGAGLDARALRFGLGFPFWEIDHPATAALKRQAIGDTPMPATWSQHTCDFTDGALAATLQPLRGVRTAVLWEGVTMYLPRVAVVDSLQAMSGLGAGSRLWVDAYTHGDDGSWREGIRRAGSIGLTTIGEPLRYAPHPEDFRLLLAAHGWEVDEVYDHRAIRKATGRRSLPGLYVVSATRG